METSNDNTGVSALKKHNYGLLAIIGMVYCSAAAGAFGVEEMISGCGPGMTVILLILIALLWGIPDSFRIAELSSLMPGEGGYYYWGKKLFGEFWAFQMGWWGVVSYYTGGSTFIVLAVDYLSTICDLSPMSAIIIKVVIVILFTVINLLGLKEVSATSTFFAILILIAFGAVTVIGFANWKYNPIMPIIPEDSTVISSLGDGIGIGIWMYCGWGSITYIAGEVKNNQVISKALRIVVPLIALSYLLPTVAGLASVGNWDSWTTVGSEGVGFSTILENFAGPAATTIFIIIAICGQLAMFNTTITGGSRVMFVLADDHLCPKKFLTNVSKKRGVPYVGILSISVVTMLMMQLSFQALVLIQVIPTFALAIFVSAAMIKARRVYPVEDRIKEGKFVVGMGKLGKWVVIILPAMIAVIAFFLNGMDYFIYGLIFLIIGILFYLVCKPVFGGLWKDDPEHYPVNAKTKLAYGDLFRIGDFMLIIGLASVMGGILLRFIEGQWGPEYYLEEYGSGLLSDFQGMLTLLLIGGFICILISAAVYFTAHKIDKRTIMPVLKKDEQP